MQCRQSGLPLDVPSVWTLSQQNRLISLLLDLSVDDSLMSYFTDCQGVRWYTNVRGPLTSYVLSKEKIVCSDSIYEPLGNIGGARSERSGGGQHDNGSTGKAL